uniref:Uncharacterized protein n=1 Tax=Oryza brachyantha TaxID=4533 RepID=J3KY41_ORYBR
AARKWGPQAVTPGTACLPPLLPPAAAMVSLSCYCLYGDLLIVRGWSFYKKKKTNGINKIFMYMFLAI